MNHAPDRLPPLNGQRRRLIGISLLPSAATLGNLLCGVMAVVCCLIAMRGGDAAAPTTRSPYILEFFPTYVASGAYLIILAMIFDALDGRLARMTRRTSEFGAQLDSIADIVSFGAAPALLLVTLLLGGTGARDASPANDALWRLGLLATAVYVSCAAIRLARYNAENTRDETSHTKFSGLPAPGAAAGFVALIILHEQVASGLFDAWGTLSARAILWTILPAAFGLGLLMVSRLDYVHVFNVYVRREHPPTHLVWLVIAAGIAWFSPQVLIVLLSWTYVISGLVLNIGHRRRFISAAAAGESAEHIPADAYAEADDVLE